LLTTFIGPILHQRSGDATDHSRNANVHRISWQLTLFCLLITLIAFVLALGMHEWIFALLVAPNYRSVSYLLPWVLLAGGLFAAGQVLSLKLMSDMNTATLLWPKLTTAVVGVGLNFLGAYYAGLHGIVMAAIAFALLHLIWLALLSASRPIT
jgi:O-antigen/teichoic acid export membrane protein